jgi:hypothetical protein
MSIRGSVGSLIESHRAQGSHPDRRIFIPQTAGFQPQRIFQDGFPGQTVKPHQEFQIGIHDSHELNAVLSRADASARDPEAIN